MTLSMEQKRRMLERFSLEVVNGGDMALADELIDPLAVTPYAPTLLPGPQGCKVIAQMFRSAFPDLHVTVESILAQDDLVAARLRQTATHQGDLFGIPPTGKAVDFEEIALVRMLDGKIFVTWFETDLMTVMQQIGVAPSPT